MERIFSRSRRLDPATAHKKNEERIGELSKLSFDEAERQIAEDHFRKPIVILNAVAIRPFWRDGRKAPPLPFKKEKSDIAREHR